MNWFVAVEVGRLLFGVHRVDAVSIFWSSVYGCPTEWKLKSLVEPLALLLLFSAAAAAAETPVVVDAACTNHEWTRTPVGRNQRALRIPLRLWLGRQAPDCC